MSRPIVIFLQNAWFKEGTHPRHLKMYAEDVDFRRKVLQMSMTGRRLMSAFGEFWFEKIWWDNASPVAAIGHHRGLKEADPTHMRRVLNEQSPKVIGLFGKQAEMGYREVIKNRDSCTSKLLGAPVIVGRHPNAMGIKQIEINEIAQKIVDLALA